MQHHRVLLFLLSAACAASCASGPALVEVPGSCADVFGGQVCTWATTQGDALVEVGVRVPVAALENAPAEAGMTWPPVPNAVLELPESVRARSGLTEFTMFWEAMGHPPGPYMTPHFDFHFYTIPRAQREAIDCQDATKPESAPAGYSLPDIDLPPDVAGMLGVSRLVGLCVPQMGMHGLLTSELQSQDPFRATMVVGYYGGRPIFMEPMVTRAMLLEKQSFDLPIPDVPGMGPRPTKFRADYDAAQNTYRMTLSGFVPGD